MGLDELLGSLKKNKQSQIDTIWQEANREAESLRKQVDEAIADITKKHAEQLASACQKSMRSIFSDTEIKTRTKKLLAYQTLYEMLPISSCPHYGKITMMRFLHNWLMNCRKEAGKK